jgi:hypothetical protein
MSNSACLSGPAFSITGDLFFIDQQVEFQLSFNSEADQAEVKAYEWFLDNAVLILQNLSAFNSSIPCGSHTIGARILSDGGWSGIQYLSFKTCWVPVSILINGADTVTEGTSTSYSVIATYPDYTTQDVTGEYTFSCPDGNFTGNIFTPAVNPSDPPTRLSVITASKDGAEPLTKQITIISIVTNSVGILVVDLYDNTTLNAIGLIVNAEVINNHVAAYTGNNIIPPGSTPSDALILASDVILSGRLSWRFEFNIARLLTDYPASTQFVFDIKGRGNAASAISGSYVLKTFNAQMTLTGSAGSYIPSVIGSNIEPPIDYNSTVVAGANGSFNEADLTTIIRFNYNVSDETITYTTHQNPIEVNDFDFMSVRYHWEIGDGTDLDTLVGFENNGTQYDGSYVGYGQPNATVPPNNVPQADAYLWWGSDNTSGSGYEAVLIGLKKFVNDFPSSPDVVEVGLYAVWFGPPQSGDFTVELVTYKGGTMSLSGTDFVNTGGVQVSSNTVQVNTLLMNANPHTPSNMYKVGSVKYTKSTQSAVIEIN